MKNVVAIIAEILCHVSLPRNTNSTHRCWSISLEEKEHTELGWDSYNEITSMLTWFNPNEENTVNAVIVIDESVRPKLAKFHVLKLHHSKIKT